MSATVLHVLLSPGEKFRSYGTERNDQRSMAVSRIALQRLFATGGIRASAGNGVYQGTRLLAIHPSRGSGFRSNSTATEQPTASPPPAPLQNVIFFSDDIDE